MEFAALRACLVDEEDGGGRDGVIANGGADVSQF